MVKKFVLIEHQEYDQHDKSENMDTSILSIQQLLNAVKSRVGIMYHSGIRTKSPRTKPPRTKSPGQNPPGQNPP